MVFVVGVTERQLKTPVVELAEFGMSTKAASILAERYLYIGELVGLTSEDILEGVPNFGPNMLQELRESLSAFLGYPKPTRKKQKRRRHLKKRRGAKR